jgi:SAM-dependent methyltransferase
MWDSRYAGDNFFYGKAPNIFLAEFLSTQSKKGKLLLPAEGEGRNAVYAAKLGWDVYAFDSSNTARVKALKFAEAENIKIRYTHQDIVNYLPEVNKYDLVALVFVHLPEEIRIDFHQKIIQSLTPGGTLLVVSFAKEQINNFSGGPPRSWNALFHRNPEKRFFRTYCFEFVPGTGFSG